MYFSYNFIRVHPSNIYQAKKKQKGKSLKWHLNSINSLSNMALNVNPLKKEKRT